MQAMLTSICRCPLRVLKFLFGIARLLISCILWVPRQLAPCFLYLPSAIHYVTDRCRGYASNLLDLAKEWYQNNECAVLYQPAEQLLDDSQLMGLLNSFVSRFNKRTRFELKPKEHFNMYDATSSPLVKLLLVPCLIANKLGTDVERVIRSHHFPEGIGTAHMVLLVLQHRDPNECRVKPTRAVLGSFPHDQKFADIIDVVFTSRHGVYRCEQNDAAVRQLVEVCISIGIRPKRKTFIRRNNKGNNPHSKRSPGKLYSKMIP